MKDKSKYFRDVDHMIKIPRKITANHNFIKKMNSIKGQKRIDKFFDPYFDILIH